MSRLQAMTDHQNSHSPKNIPQRSSSSPPNRDTAARVSSPGPLAPLEYLQNQRRGSITDPSLHAASINSQLLRHQHQNASSVSHDSANKNPADPRPTSPYVFGNATSHIAENSPQLRKLLRSPSLDHDIPPSTKLNNERNISTVSENSVLEGKFCLLRSRGSYRACCRGLQKQRERKK